eukprot:scaffold6752_cov92-Isochrysis_galbana.AAC.2
MIVDMDPHGRMSTKIGFLVWMVEDCRAWWSMMPTICDSLMAGLSWVVCWKSTRQTRADSPPCSAMSSSTGRMLSSETPHVSSANSVSELMPDARAGTPPYRAAAPMAPAMESRSATRCPQKMAPFSSGTCDSTASAVASTSISLRAVDHSFFTASSTGVSSRDA